MSLRDEIKDLDADDAMLRVFAVASESDPAGWFYLKSAQHYLEINHATAREIAGRLEAHGLLESAPGEFGPRWRLTAAGWLNAAANQEEV